MSLFKLNTSQRTIREHFTSAPSVERWNIQEEFCDRFQSQSDHRVGSKSYYERIDAYWNKRCHSTRSLTVLFYPQNLTATKVERGNCKVAQKSTQ